MQKEGEGSSEADFVTYLMRYEGIDIGEWDDNNDNDHDIKNNFNTQYTENGDSGATQYLTSYEIFDSLNIINILNNQVTIYVYTKTDLFGKDPIELAIQFYFQDRYSSAIFQGIMPDTGVAGVSTVGEN